MNRFIYFFVVFGLFFGCSKKVSEPILYSDDSVLVEALQNGVGQPVTGNFYEACDTITNQAVWVDIINSSTCDCLNQVGSEFIPRSCDNVAPSCNLPTIINPSCGIFRISEAMFDNGFSAGSSSNDCGDRPNLVFFNQGFIVDEFRCNGRSYGEGEQLGPYTLWTPELQGWADFGNKFKDDKTNAAFGRLPAPTWRFTKYTSIDPCFKIGTKKMTRITDGCQYTVYPLPLGETYKTVWYYHVIEKGVKKVKFCQPILDENGYETNEYEETERPTWQPVENGPDVPIPLDCIKDCGYKFEYYIEDDAVSPCTTERFNLCQKNEDGTAGPRVVRLITDCPERSNETYTEDSYLNAESPDDLVEYAGEVINCDGTDFSEPPIEVDDDDCVSIQTGNTICALIGNEKDQYSGDLWIYQNPCTGDLTYQDCSSLEFITEFKKIDCECDYNKITINLCTTGEDGCTEFTRTLAELSNCEDIFESTGTQQDTTDYNASGQVIETYTGDDIAPCQGCDQICEQACYMCDASTATPQLDPVRPIKVQIAAVQIKLQLVKNLTVKKQLTRELESLKRKALSISSAFPCKVGDQLSGMICDGVFTIDGEVTDTTGFKRLPTCDIEVCEIDQTVKVVGLPIVECVDACADAALQFTGGRPNPNVSYQYGDIKGTTLSEFNDALVAAGGKQWIAAADGTSPGLFHFLCPVIEGAELIINGVAQESPTILSPNPNAESLGCENQDAFLIKLCEADIKAIADAINAGGFLYEKEACIDGKAYIIEKFSNRSDTIAVPSRDDCCPKLTKE